MKFCLTCSAGGHLTQMRELERCFTKHEHFFVLYKNEITKSLAKGEEVYFVVNPERKPILYLQNFFQSLKIFLKEKPDVIITTGAGISLMTCIIAKLFRKKLIFIESFSRVNDPSSFGKLLYPISDLTIVQWKQLLKYYKKAVYGGSIFDFSSKSMDENEVKNQILITVGTEAKNFDRLIKEIDKLIESGKIKEKVIAQLGYTEYKPKNYEHFKFCSRDEFEQYIKESRIIIAHGGAGTIITGIKQNKKIIVTPRMKKFNEHIDDHQLQIAKEFEEQGLVIAVYDIKKLENAVKQAENFHPSSFNEKSKVREIIQDKIEEWNPI